MNQNLSQPPYLSDSVSIFQGGFFICLAPMVGLTHVGLRTVMRQYLPEGARTFWPTEMLNSRRIPSENLALTPETLRSENDVDLVPQILGNEKKPIEDSVQILKSWGAVGIDINMGCPVQKALKHNYGVSLMGDAQYASDVVRMTSNMAHPLEMPVSVKLRAAEGNDKEKLLEFVEALISGGADWLTLHPRTAEQKRRGRADWKQIEWLKKQIRVPLIGNGDIQTVEDAHQMRNETSCDMVMVGRALAARPWMLWQMGEDLGLPAPVEFRDRSAPRTPEEEGQEYGRCLLNFIAACEKYFHHDLALRKIRFYIRTTSVWLLFGQSLVSISTKSQNLDQLREGVRLFFSHPQEMFARTELRQ